MEDIIQNLMEDNNIDIPVNLYYPILNKCVEQGQINEAKKLLSLMKSKKIELPVIATQILTQKNPSIFEYLK